MTGMWIYAIVDAPPAAPLGHGLADEPLEIIACGELFAVAGALDAAPAVAVDALRRHDAVVRRLAAEAPALLPARFGSFVTDEAAVAALVAPRAAALRARLARVRGCAQMTVRVYGEVAPPAPAPHARRSGTDYLRERQRLADPRQSVPALAALDRFVLDERVERHATPLLLLTVHHLVERAHAQTYLAAADALVPGGGLRVRVTGPWAPYAFAEEIPA